MVFKANPTNNPSKGMPNGSAVAARRRNNKLDPYTPDGTPGDSLCPPGGYGKSPRVKSMYDMGEADD